MKTLSFVAIALLVSVAATAGTIAGTVTTSGSPLAGMTVAAYSTAGILQASGPTTATGSYALTVPAGAYRLLAYDPNGIYATSFFDKASSFETSASVAVASSTLTINFSLVLAGHIAGRVTASVSAIPLANITVAAYNLDGTRRAFTSTDASGHYDLTLPPGTFKLVAFDDTLTYAPAFYANRNSFANATPVTVTATQTIPIDLQLDPAATLSGRVTDRLSGAALSGITVAAYNDDGTVRGSAITDSAGAYLLGVPSGDYRIGAHDANLVYLTQFYANAPIFDLAAIIHVVAPQNASGLNLALDKGARVSGHAIDRSSARPLAGITIGAYDTTGHLILSATTDSTGGYTLLLSPATYKLLAFDTTLQYATAYFANAANFETTAALSLSSAQSIAADFVLPLAGRISGNVADASTGRAISATVIAYDVNGLAAASTVADGTGAFRLALVPGSYRIAATDPSHAYATVFYASATTFDGGTSITVAAMQEFSGVLLRMQFAVASFRHRAVSHF